MPKIILVDDVQGTNGLVVRDVVALEPAAGEVRYRVHAFSLNRADLMYVAGFHYTKTVIPSRVGYEACGVVDAVGAGVTEFKVGDRVTCIPPTGDPRYNVAGEYAITRTDFLIPWPEGFSAEEAASVWMQYFTAYFPLREIANVGAGDTVLITAASSSAGVGAIQLAKMLGATVIASSRTNAKADFLRKVGADHVVTYDQGPLAEQIAALPVPGGVRVVFDSVAGPAMVSYADALAPGAHIFIYGALSGVPTVECPILPFIRPGASIHFYSLINVITRPGALDRARNFLEPAVASGKLRPVVDRVFPFEEALAAYAYMDSGAQKGKIVVRTNFADEL